ncbi:DUF6521 family protein [Bacillus zanthoxyli]|nr:DUF6521 family protein [Bacillus zanthoxyli]
MIKWETRPVEVANLLNPAFCGMVLREFIASYQGEGKQGISYELVFLILSILLHKDTREKFPTSTRKHMHVWIQENPEIRIGFSQRTKELVSFTKESLTFLLLRNYIFWDETGKLNSTKKRYKASFSNQSQEFQQYTKEYLGKARLAGKWFPRSGSNLTIYTMWGIRP